MLSCGTIGGYERDDDDVDECDDDDVVVPVMMTTTTTVSLVLNSAMARTIAIVNMMATITMAAETCEANENDDD